MDELHEAQPSDPQRDGSGDSRNAADIAAGNRRRAIDQVQTAQEYLWVAAQTLQDSDISQAEELTRQWLTREGRPVREG